MVLRPEPRLVQHLRTERPGRLDERVDRRPIGGDERDVDRAVVAALAQRAHSEVGLAVGTAQQRGW